MTMNAVCPECKYWPCKCPRGERRRNAADAADKLAVKIVTLVANRISEDGKLYAYDGIEAAREIKRMILDEMT